MADGQFPSTSRAPLPKKPRISDEELRTKNFYTEAEIQQLLDDLQFSDDEIELIDDIDESDFDEEPDAPRPSQDNIVDQRTTSVSNDELEANVNSASEEPVHNPQHSPNQEVDHSSSSSEKWFPTCPDLPKIKFTGDKGMKVTPQHQTPMGYFDLFFSDEFFMYLKDEINDYAKYVLFEAGGATSRISKWKEVEVEDSRKFIGVMFLMGLIRVNRINDYWKKHYLFNLACGKFMSRDRYLVILRCLHFQKEREGNDPIYKIRPMMDYFNKKMIEICNPSRNLTIDESMVLWRGQLKFRQYIKRHKFGVKLYVLAEPDGLVQKLHIYGGSGDIELSGQGHSVKVVSKLMDGLEGKGHALFMDNFYNSVTLTEDLLSKNVYCTGTLQPRRKGNPQDVMSKEVEKGETFCRYTKEGVCCCKWKDKRDVFSISSEFGGNLVTTKNKRGQEKQKPELVAQYNKYMKGVDRQDQMLAYCPITHKTLRWYKKLGIHLFHIMINNSYYLYNRYSKEKRYDLHDFLLEIVSTLLPDPREQHHLESSTHIHLPEYLPENTKGEVKRKRCKYCFDQNNIRKETRFGCPSCPGFPGLCVSPCFREHHKYK